MLLRTELDYQFRDWMNHIDAIITYDERRRLGNVENWRGCFDAGMSESEAIHDNYLFV